MSVIAIPNKKPDVKLYVGAGSSKMKARDGVTRELDTLAGTRMFSAAYKPYVSGFDVSLLECMLDSGAFTDVDKRKHRLTYEEALTRQLEFERKANVAWQIVNTNIQDNQTLLKSYALVSYDELIDEQLNDSGQKIKARWQRLAAEQAVITTINAAYYLANKRDVLAPRRLVLSCQGVDAIQYTECAIEILKVIQPNDIFGLGGWCILGMKQSLINVFWQTLYRVIPLIAASGVKDIHIFGVMWRVPLGGLLWLCDQYGLNLSTDSTKPILDTTWANKKQSGAKFDYWLDNVVWWQNELANLRQSRFYKAPPNEGASRQFVMDLAC